MPFLSGCSSSPSNDPNATAGSTPQTCNSTTSGCQPPDPCPDSRINPQDDAMIACILQLCATDPDVIARARSRILINSRDPKQVQLLRYDGANWIHVRTSPSLGSQRDNRDGTREIWINRNETCETTKETFYHETHHTTQPSTMSSREKEVDAFTQTEQWMIDRGITGNAHFRRTEGQGRDARQVPDTAAIERYVERVYGHQRGKPRIIGRSRDGRTVTLRDHTTRPAEPGDQMQYTPPQELCSRRIDPARLTCP